MKWASEAHAVTPLRGHELKEAALVALESIAGYTLARA